MQQTIFLSVERLNLRFLYSTQPPSSPLNLHRILLDLRKMEAMGPHDSSENLMKKWKLFHKLIYLVISTHLILFLRQNGNLLQVGLNIEHVKKNHHLVMNQEIQ